jgi:hypothetical protein
MCYRPCSSHPVWFGRLTVINEEKCLQNSDQVLEFALQQLTRTIFWSCLEKVLFQPRLRWTFEGIFYLLLLIIASVHLVWLYECAVFCVMRKKKKIKFWRWRLG